MTRAAKVQSAASAGQDFAKLATDNTSDPAGKRTGGAAEFSFETRFMLPQSVRDAIQKMSPGQVSKVLDTPQGIYIVKLESVQARVPAKLDDKAKKARKDELTQDRQMVVAAEFREQLQRGQKVEVSDPEFLAYWQLMGAMSAGSDPQEYGKQMKLAISSLRKASGGRANNYVHIQLARLLDRDGQTAEAVRILYPMLEGKDASVEGADLRILLGDMLMKTGAKGDKERALAQYQEAGEVAPHDPEIHQQLLGKFKELKRPDLVAKEEAWMADFLQRMAQMQEMRKKQAPAPGKAPSAPPAR
jgi:tetratricopeptide (TPR) repeat protein